MCTSIAMTTQDFYFGRTMDLNYELNTNVVITPRNFPFPFRKTKPMNEHFALLGMAAIAEGFPLYAEAVNEKGLCIAGLNFPDQAFYPEEESSDKTNISPFELPQWILGQCATVAEAEQLLSNTHLINLPFSRQLPLSPLHWHIADRERSLAVESTRDGFFVHENPAGVLTNNPAFPFQMTNLCQYMNLISGCPKNCFSDLSGIQPFGQGLGSFGLPGDFSPASRFVRASYLKLNSICMPDEESSVSQFFHLLGSVAVPRGSVITSEENCSITTYSSCINASKGIYYYRTYSNQQLTAIDMRKESLDAKKLKIFPLLRTQQITWMN
ncbi:MAG: choloylglycine hydrolase family protein [Ruminococcus sp.]|nr:choloylglycine hydrolase family protein [Ruminococcus sp.]